MTDLVKQYLKKVARDTDDEELRDGINSMSDELDDDEIPSELKSKSSFKEANKRMKEIEDGRDNKKT